jgi:hypothetical protein
MKMTTLDLLKQTGRAALLAVALAGTALSAAPAQAAPPQGFSLEVKPQGGDQKQQRQFQQKQFAPNDFYNWCLSDRQIRSGLRRYGFSDVTVVDSFSRNRVRVEATYDDWVYSMRIHRCTGTVDRIRKLYPVWEDDDYDW